MSPREDYLSTLSRAFSALFGICFLAMAYPFLHKPEQLPSLVDLFKVFVILIAIFLLLVYCSYWTRHTLLFVEESATGETVSYVCCFALAVCIYATIVYREAFLIAACFTAVLGKAMHLVREHRSLQRTRTASAVPGEEDNLDPIHRRLTDARRVCSAITGVTWVVTGALFLIKIIAKQKLANGTGDGPKRVADFLELMGVIEAVAAATVVVGFLWYMLGFGFRAVKTFYETMDAQHATVTDSSTEHSHWLTASIIARITAAEGALTEKVSRLEKMFGAINDDIARISRPRRKGEDAKP